MCCILFIFIFNSNITLLHKCVSCLRPWPSDYRPFCFVYWCEIARWLYLAIKSCYSSVHLLVCSCNQEQGRHNSHRTVQRCHAWRVDHVWNAFVHGAGAWRCVNPVISFAFNFWEPLTSLSCDLDLVCFMYDKKSKMSTIR